MKLLIISAAPLIKKDTRYFAYGPYVNEMKIWANNVEQVQFCCPVWESSGNLLVSEILFEINKPLRLLDFNIKSLPSLTKAIVYSIGNFIVIFKAMWNTDHIHLRCPGNMGLLGCLVQILFPKKTKTAKYAGNWDPKSKQPFSYKLQQWILRNTFFTRNMTVLVYGEWPNETKNIKPFFTATYLNKDAVNFHKSEIRDGLNLVFIGALVKGKSPITSLEVLNNLIKRGVNATLTYCGDGPERKYIENLSREYGLKKHVNLLGNVDGERVKLELQKAHFLVFISESEGWPKVVAEAMWWGCIPITTSVSCVPQMLGDGKRGFLVSNSPTEISEIIIEISNDEEKINQMKVKGMKWAREFTLERFENEIKLLLQK